MSISGSRLFLACGASAAALMASSAGWAQPATPTEVESLTVTGAKTAAPVAVKTDVPVLETPQAISVITADTLRDQGITRLADALRGVAGVSRSSTYGYYDSYQIRGYDAAYGSIFLDGLTSGNVAGAVNELAGLEQVEVIKGPASALFGASPLGGVINLVSKRPTTERFVDLGLSTGSYDLREVVVDANTPLVGSTLLGRLNLVYRDSDDFVDFAHAQRIYIAPALTWNIAPQTKLTLLGRFQRDYDAPWSPVSAWGTILPNANGEAALSRSINNDGALAAVNNQKSKQIGYVFDHRFSAALSVSQTLRYEKREVFWDQWMFVAGFTDENVVGGVQQGRTLGRYLYGPFSEADTDLAADTRANAKFSTGPIAHNVLFGVDYRRNTNTASGAGNYNALDNPLDLFTPDYSRPFVRDPSGDYVASAKSSQTGVYLHDHLDFGGRLSLTLGGRWDTAKADAQEDSKFSPHAGVTWLLRPDASVYFNYSKSFTPTPSWQTTVTGDLLPPETGENIEVGLKVQGMDGKLSGLVSIYQLTRQNVATTDPANPFFYIVTGEQRSRGLEVEGVWRPVEAIEVSGAYAYTDAKITKDNSFPVGIPLPNFPEHSLGLQGKYTVQNGRLAKLTVSLGLLYNSEKHFYEGQLYDLAGYTLVNGGLSYPVRDWIVQLNLDNLTDERFFPDACCLDRVTPGEPRSWRLGLRRRF